MAVNRNLKPDRSLYALRNGDCMLRSEFHTLYLQMPEDYRAELIGGMVFEPSPLTWWHSEHHVKLAYLLETYALETPGTGLGDNATVILSKTDEVQPDLLLRVTKGGKSKLTKRGYVQGAPELIAEIAYSGRAIDLHLKKQRYASAGVIEYIVVCLEPRQLYWFDLKNQSELATHEDVIKSTIFAGLWIHAEALLELDTRLLLDTLGTGIESEEHKQFLAKLASR